MPLRRDAPVFSPQHLEVVPPPSTNVAQTQDVMHGVYVSPAVGPQTTPSKRFLDDQPFHLYSPNEFDDLPAATPDNFAEICISPLPDAGDPVSISYEECNPREAKENYDEIWKSRHQRESQLWGVLSQFVNQLPKIVRFIADFEIVGIDHESRHNTLYTDGRFDTYNGTYFNVKTIAEGPEGILMLNDFGRVNMLGCGAPIQFHPQFAKNCIGVFSIATRSENKFTVLKSDGLCFSWVAGKGQGRSRISKKVKKVWVCGDLFKAVLADGRNIILSF